MDAILTGKIWNVVHRYCIGEWGSLSKVWTTHFQKIVNEEKHRGLESFVSTKTISEGYWLLQVENGYLVCYLERGIKVYPEEFTNLESAFCIGLKMNCNHINCLLFKESECLSQALKTPNKRLW